MRCTGIKKSKSSFRLLLTALTFLITTTFICTKAHPQNCPSKNLTFKPGEKATYIVSYNWFIVWTDVGKAVFTIQDTIYKKNRVYHYQGIGETFNSWNWIFKVYDKYQSFLNTETMRPMYFRRDINEGKFRQLVTYDYNYEKNITLSQYKVNDNPLRNDTLPLEPCTFDVLSGILYSRNMDFTGRKIGEIIPVSILLDQEVYLLHFRYLGIENKKIKHIGTFECIKFSVMLVEGSVFKDGENMIVWITNDQNRLPVYVETPILVGSVKVRISDISGNRYPFTSYKH